MFRVGTWTCQEEEGHIYTIRRVQDGVDAQNRPFGKAIGSRPHTVGESELNQEERYVLEGYMREANEREWNSLIHSTVGRNRRLQ